jgi:hypothetical protein
MPFGRKGANWGAGILIIAFITMMIIAIVAAAFQGGGFGVGDPTYVVKYYEKLFSAENLKNPFALVFTVFVPFVSTFAITWAFIGVLPIFQGGYGHKTGERSAAVLAFGISLYTLPMMNMFLLSFFPWSIAIAVIMLFIGLIGRSLHWGIVPHLEAAEGIAGSARGIQKAWDSYKSPRSEGEKEKDKELKERKEVEEKDITDFSDRWRQALTGYIDSLIDNRIRSPNVSNLRNLSKSGNWQNLCSSLENIDRERRRAMQIGNTMMQALQTPKEFRNLFRDQYMAAGLLDEFQKSIEHIREFHDAARRNLEDVAQNLLPRANKKSVPVDEAHDLVVLWQSIEEYLGRYNEFFNWQRSETGDIRTLRTRTIDLLHIQV